MDEVEKSRKEEMMDGMLSCWTGWTEGRWDGQMRSSGGI